MKHPSRYRLAARTEAAGKFDPSAPQEGNEDNYGLIFDVAHPTGQVAFDEAIDLGDMGLLMYVADGMGGHSAGEVASKLAVDTVSEAFAEGKVDPGIAATHEARSLFLEGLIRDADKRIRAYSKENAGCEGMGSTLIIAWLVGDELTVSWCGDSRCYLYRPKPEPRIAMVSEDHSYVQELVQRGVIPYEASFAHPQGNVITRCLGGGGEKSEPESRKVKVGQGDIVLLCSDGLSGVLFDDGRLFDGQPISEENICDIITAQRGSLRGCLQELFAAAERQNWYDNVTAILCEVVEGAKAPAAWPPVPSHAVSIQPVPTTGTPRRRKLTWMWITLAVLAVVASGIGGYFVASSISRESKVVDTAGGNGTILPPQQDSVTDKTASPEKKTAPARTAPAKAEPAQKPEQKKSVLQQQLDEIKEGMRQKQDSTEKKEDGSKERLAKVKPPIILAPENRDNKTEIEE